MTRVNNNSGNAVPDITGAEANQYISVLLDRFDRANSHDEKEELAAAISEALSGFMMVETEILFNALTRTAAAAR